MGADVQFVAEFAAADRDYTCRQSAFVALDYSYYWTICNIPSINQAMR